jgi:hypothetical protein
MSSTPVPTFRPTPALDQIRADLGLLADLAGSWSGEGFNLIARPDFQGNANLYLQLNQTREDLKFDPIGSAIPNRGFGQEDIQLFGLTYLQKISDLSNGGALHIEPGIWVTQPPTNFPPETAPPPGQIVARMASIPHGNAMLALGTAEPFTGPPVLTTAAAQYTGSLFPSFNSTPFATTPTAPTPPGPLINAAGSDEKTTAANTPKAVAFTQYDLSVAASSTNPRTPFGTDPPDPALPATINGVAMQSVINDPILLLQAVINDQVAGGFTFAGTAINIATQAQVTFLKNANSGPGTAAQPAPSTVVPVPDGAGGIENILFLLGNQAPPPPQPNAQTALVYATFWIEKVTTPGGTSFMQLQYAQMVILNFPILTAPAVVLGWPHISVATLRKAFD